MEVKAVLKFFGVTPESSITELNTAYRAYLKRYRPENNPDREAWARHMLAKLNQAYDVALEHLSETEKHRRAKIAAESGQSSRERAGSAGARRSSDPHDSTGPRPSAGDPYRARREERARSFAATLFAADATEAERRYSFFDAFFEAVDDALEGMFLYYQYGCQNIHLRHEGSRSLRYRAALRKLDGASARLAELKPYAASSNDLENIVTFSEFATAFLHSMKIEKAHNPAGRPIDVSAYKHYHHAAQGLDNAIRDAFFEELREKGPSAASNENLELCSREFMVVLTAHLESTWVTEAAIKAYLLESFTKLLKRSAALSAF